MRALPVPARGLLAPLVPFLVKFVPFLLAPDFLLAFPREILLYFLIMKNTLNSGISRRRFLAATGVAAAFPTIIPASALGRGGQPAPSERITIGSVGWGSMGPGNTDSFMSNKDCQVVAICDLDKNRLQGALDHINAHYGNKDCKPYHDYREVFARSDIDAVMLAVPDHWHALLATAAANAKKDIYGEKPLARTIAEQQAIVHAVQKNKRIWQTGSWQRSQGGQFRKAAEIVRSGLIGKIKRVEVGLPAGHGDPKVLQEHGSPSEPPPELDYDFWIGPSTLVPYVEARVHYNWRWNYNTGGGQLLDWIGHHCDIAHWGMDMDNGGPSEVEAHGERPPEDAVWNTYTKYRATLKYPNDIEMTIAGGHGDIRSGAKWIGTDGWVWVDRGKYDASNVDWFAMPEDQLKVKLYHSEEHRRNFLDCVKSRKPTITPAETAHHSAIPGHLTLISMLVGRKIKWDAASEKILDDAEATKLLSRLYRAPWKLA